MPTLLTSTAITAIQFKEGASPGTPSSGYGRCYVASDGTLHYVNDAGTDISLSGLYTGGIAIASQAAGDLITGASGTALGRLAVGTAYQVLHSTGTAPAYTSTLGATGTRLTAGFFVDLTVTNAIAGSVTGNAGTATNIAAGAAGSVPYQSGASTTTFLGIGAANTVLTSSGSAPQWSTSLTLAGGISATTGTFSQAGDNSVTITTTGTSNAARSILASGNGTTSAKYAYATAKSLETSPQEWRWGMYGDAFWTLYDYTNNRIALTVSATSGAFAIKNAADVAGDFSVATNKFTVASATGNTGWANGSVQLALHPTFLYWGLGWGGVESSAAANPLIYSDGNYIAINSKAGSSLYLNYDNTNAASYVNAFNGKFTISKDGNTTIAGTLTVSGHGTTASAANAFLDSSTGLLSRSTSSRRYKTDIEALGASEALATLAALQPITYRGTNPTDGNRRWAGFVAEDVAAVAPMLATYDADGTPNYVTYDRIPAYLVAGWQSHDARIAALEAEISALKARVH